MNTMVPLAVILSLGLCVILDTAEHVAYSLVGRLPHRRVRWVVLGVGLHVVALAIWLWLLTRIPLGQALPLRGSGYITIALAGRVLFKEQVKAVAWMGIGVIVLGVALICRGA